MRWSILLCALCSAWVLTTPVSSARAEFDEIRFRATDTADVDFFRVLIGKTSRQYGVQIPLHDVSFDATGVGVARVPGFAEIFEPGERYFIAMTTVNLAGVQSDVSDEFVLDVPRSTPQPAADPAPGATTTPGATTAGPSTPEPPPGESLRFRVVDTSDVDFFRVFVGLESLNYRRVIQLDDVTFDASGVATARVPEFANLFLPGRSYFIAMTTVNLAGVESALSQEFVLETAPDRDRDGVTDALDNCPATPNPDQADNGGVASPQDPTGQAPDGVGDACQCGDVIRDGRVTFDDAVALFRVIVRRQLRFQEQSQASGETVFEPLVTRTCNVVGEEICDGLDAFAIAAAVRRSGTIHQSCRAAGTSR